MLARRFSIVCLLLTLFGMGLSAVVAQDRSNLGSLREAGQSCLLDHRPGCAFQTVRH